MDKYGSCDEVVICTDEGYGIFVGIDREGCRQLQAIQCPEIVVQNEIE